MPTGSRRNRNVLAFVLALAAGSLAAYLYVNFKATRLVEGAFAEALGRPVSVRALGVGAASGITLYGLEIKNPPGARARNILEIKSISFTPDLARLIRGEAVFYYTGIKGPVLYLEKTADGIWNFEPVIQHLKRRRPRKFTLERLVIKGGRIVLPGGKAELNVRDAELRQVSSISPGPSSFMFEADDGKGILIRGSGGARLFAPRPGVSGKVSFKAARLDEYVKPPAGLEVRDASASGGAGFTYSDGAVSARFDVRLTGVKSRYGKGGRLDALFAGEAFYLADKDTLALDWAELDVPGLASARLKGSVTDLRGRPEAGLMLTAGPVELARLGPYLPGWAGLGGRLVPEAFSVSGPLMKPRIAGNVKVEDASFTLKGVGVRAVSGDAGIEADTDGGVSAKLQLRQGKGGISGLVEYSARQARFVLRARGVELTRMEGEREAPAGRLDGFAEGSSSGGITKVRYSLDGSGLRPGREAKVSARLQGEAVGTKGSWGGSGRLSAGQDKAVGGIIFSAGYSHSGDALFLRGPALKYGGLDARAGRFEARLEGRRLRAAASGMEISRAGAFSSRGGRAVAVIEMPENGPVSANLSFTAASAEILGLAIGTLNGAALYSGGRASFGLSGGGKGNILNIKASALMEGVSGLKNPSLSAKLRIRNPNPVGTALKGRGLPVSVSGGAMDISVSLSGKSPDALAGEGRLRLDGVDLGYGGRAYLRKVSADLRPAYARGTLTFPASEIKTAGGLGFSAGGRASRDGGAWSAAGSIVLPETELALVQEELLEALPPALKWADMGGKAALTAGLEYRAGSPARLTGALRLSRATLGLPDKKIYVGPVDGALPLGLSFGGKRDARPEPFRREGFERGDYPALLKKYSAPAAPDLVIKKASYGFVELGDIRLSVKPGDGRYEVGLLGMSGFGGRGCGYGLVDLAGGEPGYALSLIVSDFSLAAFTDSVPAIKGYISGRVDGLARAVITGGGYKGITGAGSFWAKDAPGEKKRISKEFIKKLAGKNLKKYMLLGDRSYDTGELRVVFSGGDVVFDRLLISNRNFLGFQDLMITVAPVSNKISIEHLLDTVREVGERAGAANQGGAK